MTRRSASRDATKRHQGLSRSAFTTVLWTLCGVSTVFLVSRFLVRMRKKGKLRTSDYFLIPALPCLFAGATLLHASLITLYSHASEEMITGPDLHAGASDRITSAIELLWITVYCVKASFLAQFKFHKPLFASVSKVLTRLYWTTVGICGSSFLFTLAVPIRLCHSPERCKYFSSSSTVTWETALSTIDIVTDVFVIAIPLSLIFMANFTLLRAAINAVFKSLSIFTIAIAITRMSRQSKPRSQSADYIQVTFWLMVEANVALIAASVSSYRIVVLDYLTSRSARGVQLADPTQVDDRHVPSTRGKDCQSHQVAKIANALTLHGPYPARASTVHA